MTRATQPAAQADRVYRQGHPNRCPDCGHSSWQVGRTSAECLCCETALPFANPQSPTHLGD